jgi:hypothetical protein
MAAKEHKEHKETRGGRRRVSTTLRSLRSFAAILLLATHGSSLFPNAIISDSYRLSTAVYSIGGCGRRKCLPAKELRRAAVSARCKTKNCLDSEKIS